MGTEQHGDAALGRGGGAAKKPARGTSRKRKQPHAPEKIASSVLPGTAVRRTMATPRLTAGQAYGLKWCFWPGDRHGNACGCTRQHDSGCGRRSRFVQHPLSQKKVCLGFDPRVTGEGLAIHRLMTSAVRVEAFSGSLENFSSRRRSPDCGVPDLGLCLVRKLPRTVFHRDEARGSGPPTTLPMPVPPPGQVSGCRTGVPDEPPRPASSLLRIRPAAE